MSNSDQERERRLSPRVYNEGAVQVEYILPDPRVRDLSISGLYVADPRPLQRGQPVELKLRLGPGDPLSVRGMVRRVDPGQGMGIEFIHLEPADRRRLREYVGRAKPESVSPAGDDIFS